MNVLGIQGFIAPLVEMGFISDWYWLYNLEDGKAGLMEKGEDPYRYNNSPDLKTLPEDIKYEILDIDIDVLNGYPDNEAMKQLEKFAKMAKKAKAISIVTSPDFIDQEAAYRYAKELVKMIQQPENTAQPTDDEEISDSYGGIDLNSAIANMDIQKTGPGVSLQPISKIDDAIMNIEGFSPVIINVVPIETLPFLMGARNSSNVREAMVN